MSAIITAPSGCYCHKKGCRPGRPLCRRADRKPRNNTCYCGTPHYPHRVGSATCVHGANAQERLNALAWGPSEEIPF